jgi:aspartyl-tRNA(Asn)/glutamyl-tRNA(Gln) amidotransferase subunit A
MKDIISILSAKLRGGEHSAAELTEAYIKAIEKENPQLNALVHTTFETARAGAAEADKRLRGKDAPPLCGIPMVLKDNICTDGLPTTCCSHILDGFRPYYDAAVWEKLKAQGAVLLGKANMDEFAMGSTSETRFYRAPRNPRNTGHVTGGSSGGAAAAVC